jgi:hypothetical protein
MKYRIVIEKINDDSYCACCPSVKSLEAYGQSVDAALLALQRRMLCFVHDSDVELDITMTNTDVSNGMREKGFLPSDL